MKPKNQKKFNQYFFGCLLSIILLLGLAIRVWMVTNIFTTINSDEATIGLMAIHIIQGERPIFFYGQSYYVTLDAYLTSFIFPIFGQNSFTLRIVPLCFSLAFIYLMYLIGKKYFDQTVGIFSALYAAISPPILFVFGLHGDALYIMMLVFGALSLLVYHSWKIGPRFSKLVFLFFLTLINIFIHPVAIIILMTIFLDWLLDKKPLTARNRWQRKTYLVILILSLLSVTTIGLILKSSTIINILIYLKYFFVYSLPILFGFFRPEAIAYIFFNQLKAYPTWYLMIAIPLSFFSLLGIFWTGAQQYQRGNRIFFLLLGLTLTIFLVFMININSQVELWTTPRYLIILYELIPLGIYGISQLCRRILKKTTIVPWLILSCVFFMNLYGDTQIKPSENYQALEQWLVKQGGIQYVYVDYWIGYTMTFDTQERIISQGFTSSSLMGPYKPYSVAVESSLKPKYIFNKDDQNEDQFKSYLKMKKINYQYLLIGNYSLYFNLDTPVKYPLLQ